MRKSTVCCTNHLIEFHNNKKAYATFIPGSSTSCEKHARVESLEPHQQEEKLTKKNYKQCHKNAITFLFYSLEGDGKVESNVVYLCKCSENDYRNLHKSKKQIENTRTNIDRNGQDGFSQVLCRSRKCKHQHILFNGLLVSKFCS